MNIKAVYFLTILYFVTYTGYGQTIVNIPKEFVEAIPPKAQSYEWSELRESGIDFGIEILNGILSISKVEEVIQCELTVSNGRIVGLNNGEWGGYLTFEPFDKTKNKVEIKRGNIKFIFAYNGKLFFIEGLAHLGRSYGALYQLYSKNDVFSYVKIIDFEDYPQAFAVYQDMFLLATLQNFYIIKNFKLEHVFKDPYWINLYPNSIAVLDDDIVFIGIRGGIIKFDKTLKKFKFYKNVK